MWGFVEDSGQIGKSLTKRVETAVNAKAGFDMMTLYNGEHKRLSFKNNGVFYDIRVYNSNQTEWEYISQQFLNTITMKEEYIEKLKNDRICVNKYQALHDGIKLYKEKMINTVGSPSEIIIKHFPLFDWIRNN